MTDLNELLQMIINSPIFKWTVGTVLTTLIGWGLLDARNMRKKIKDSPTSDDLAKLKDQCFRYTDNRLELHEKDHKPMLGSIKELKEDNKRIEGKLDKLLLIMIGNKD